MRVDTTPGQLQNVCAYTAGVTSSFTHKGDRAQDSIVHTSTYYAVFGPVTFVCELEVTPAMICLLQAVRVSRLQDCVYNMLSQADGTAALGELKPSSCQQYQLSGTFCSNPLSEKSGCILCEVELPSEVKSEGQLLISFT